MGSLHHSKEYKVTLTGKANTDGTCAQVETCGRKTGWGCLPYLKIYAADATAPEEFDQAANPLYITVSLCDQKVTMLDAIKDFTCSSGESGSETPTGTFTVFTDDIKS